MPEFDKPEAKAREHLPNPDPSIRVRYQGTPPSKSAKKASSRLRSHNREQVVVWLTHYNNRFGSSGREGMINLQALPKPGPSFGPLEQAANLERLDRPIEYESDRVLSEIIVDMSRERWGLYMYLVRPYLDPDASPAIVEKWRRGAEVGEARDVTRHEMHENAVDWLVDHLPANFAVVINPRYQVARGDIEAAVQRRRQAARLKFFEYERELGTEEAVRRVGTEHGYSRKEVYKIIKTKKGR